MNILILDELDAQEEKLIEKFKKHIVLQRIESISEEVFFEILLQRRFLSFTLTAVYDLVIDALNDSTSRQIARRILREEYPNMNGNGSTPSHREDLVSDLVAIGKSIEIGKKDILTSKPTEQTLKIISRTFSLINNATIDEKLSDVKLLTILRFWGEVLVAVEYGEFWKRISKTLNSESANNGKELSRFYWPHYSHDGRTSMKEVSCVATNHSGKLGWELRKMLTSEEAQRAFIETEEKVFEIKYEFYDQFISLV